MLRVLVLQVFYSPRVQLFSLFILYFSKALQNSSFWTFRMGIRYYQYFHHHFFFALLKKYFEGACTVLRIFVECDSKHIFFQSQQNQLRYSRAESCLIEKHPILVSILVLNLGFNSFREFSIDFINDYLIDHSIYNIIIYQI